MCNVMHNQAGNGGGKEGAKIDGYEDCSTAICACEWGSKRCDLFAFLLLDAP